MRLYLLGYGLGMLLHQRGLLVLHGSAVAVHGKAVAFIGGSGSGKSTTAAALTACGYRLLVDDVLALNLGPSHVPLVPPGFPRLKLSHDAAEFLSLDARRMGRFHPLDQRWEYRPAEQESPNAPLPLVRIYILAEGAQQEVERVPPREAFEELLRHSYPPVARVLEATGSAGLHLRQCAKVAESVSVCRLRRERSLHWLSASPRVIEEDLETSGPRGPN
jgi:hypothetical protein